MDIARRDAFFRLLGAGAGLYAVGARAEDGPVLLNKPGVARMWHGRTPLARAQEYREYLFDVGVKKIASLPGNRGVQLLMRNTESEAEFMVVSYWDSIDAIKGYAGPTYENVHDLPRDAEFLIDKETKVRHFEIDVNFVRA